MGPETPDVYGQLYKGYSVVVNYTYDDLYRLVGAAYSDGATYGYAYAVVGLARRRLKAAG